MYRGLRSHRRTDGWMVGVASFPAAHLANQAPLTELAGQLSAQVPGAARIACAGDRKVARQRQGRAAAVQRRLEEVGVWAIGTRPAAWPPRIRLAEPQSPCAMVQVPGFAGRQSGFV